jgi:hypothetical protein
MFHLRLQRRRQSRLVISAQNRSHVPSAASCVRLAASPLTHESQPNRQKSLELNPGAMLLTSRVIPDTVSFESNWT